MQQLQDNDRLFLFIDSRLTEYRLIHKKLVEWARSTEEFLHIDECHPVNYTPYILLKTNDNYYLYKSSNGVIKPYSNDSDLSDHINVIEKVVSKNKSQTVVTIHGNNYIVDPIHLTLTKIEQKPFMILF